MKSLVLAISSLIILSPMSVAFAQTIQTVPPVQVPEPSTLALAAVGIIGAVMAARWRKKK